MQFRSVLVTAIALSALATGPAPAADKSVTAGPVGLAINNSGRIGLATATNIDYLNRSVANGRRNISLRLSQPMLCVDFAAPPGGAVNPVSLTYTDTNLDNFGPLYGSINSFDYFTNGASAGLFKVSAGGDLACCVMAPATNASCFQGVNGGAVAEAVYSNGFEGAASASASSVKGSSVANLAVAVNGATSASPGSNFNYSIVVSNIGGTSVSDVRVREWFPKVAGGFQAPLSAGNWTCAAAGGGVCGTAAGAGNIALNAVSLPVGASVTFSISRQLNAGATLGSQFSVSAAAFAPPAAGETALGNNQGVLTATVQQASFSINDVTQAEGNGGNTTFQFTITRSNTTGAASVVVNTANGSATAGSDYTAISNQTVNFSAGGSATATVSVTVIGDTVLEGNETFTVNLSNPSGAGITDGTGQGTITNDDAATLSINDVALSEGNSGSANATFTVTLSAAVQGGFTVPVSSSNGTATAGSDYTSIPGGTTLSFTGTAGETKTISVPVLGDTVLEPNETFNVTLGTPSNAAVTLADATGVGTINNDDAAALSIDDVSVSEGNSGTTNATFTVTLDAAVQGGFTVPVSSANGTATSGSDYTAIPGGTTLSFTGTAGETRTISVAVNGDTTLEANEAFTVSLGAPSNAAVTLADASGTGTINNDDSASIAINDVSVAEGNAGSTNATFTVTLSGSVQGGFTVPVSSQSGTATADSDFTSLPGGQTLNFQGTPGETQTVTVVVIGDTMLEPNEDFFVNLGVPSNGAITRTDSQGIGTITNDDAASLSINDVSVTEGNTGTINATFTISLNGSVQGSFSVPVSSSDDTATVANNDYVAIAPATTAIFTGAANETRTISVVVNGDTAVEPTEFFQVNLGAPNNAQVTVSDAQGIGTITNDDILSGADKRR
jgi:hypothetical protein